MMTRNSRKVPETSRRHILGLMINKYPWVLAPKPLDQVVRVGSPQPSSGRPFDRPPAARAPASSGDPTVSGR
ncbi:MAG: hypothetical protein QOI78_3312 [Actinomycetota bacterium]|nr:hypothetical protein [Actinomycetota bacterium]